MLWIVILTNRFTAFINLFNFGNNFNELRSVINIITLYAGQIAILNVINYCNRSAG